MKLDSISVFKYRHLILSSRHIASVRLGFLSADAVRAATDELLLAFRFLFKKLLLPAMAVDRIKNLLVYE